MRSVEWRLRGFASHMCIRMHSYNVWLPVWLLDGCWVDCDCYIGFVLLWHFASIDFDSVDSFGLFVCSMSWWDFEKLTFLTFHWQNEGPRSRRVVPLTPIILYREKYFSVSLFPCVISHFRFMISTSFSRYSFFKIQDFIRRKRFCFDQDFDSLRQRLLHQDIETRYTITKTPTTIDEFQISRYRQSSFEWIRGGIPMGFRNNLQSPS